jgi:hypothetical protein
MKEIETLRKWTELGRLHRSTRRRGSATWDGISRLIKVAKLKLEVDGRELKGLLDESQVLLAPFEDPFDLDMGIHRWLAEDREEAYSDWLQWIVDQLHEPALIYKMFKLEPPGDIAAWTKIPFVKREQSVDTGHEGCAGRLDLIIRFPGHALIVVEVKTGTADEADTPKQIGYASWASENREPENHLVLLATDGQEGAYDGFGFLPWAHVCIFLRRLAADKDKRPSHTATALMLAFAGAVEQNLLGMSAYHIRRVARGDSPLRNPQVVDHLKAALVQGF